MNDQFSFMMLPLTNSRGHGGRVVALSPPTHEIGVRFPARPQVGKLVVACHWSAVYSIQTLTQTFSSKRDFQPLWMLIVTKCWLMHPAGQVFTIKL